MSFLDKLMFWKREETEPPKLPDLGPSLGTSMPDVGAGLPEPGSSNFPESFEEKTEFDADAFRQKLNIDSAQKSEPPPESINSKRSEPSRDEISLELINSKLDTIKIMVENSRFIILNP